MFMFSAMFGKMFISCTPNEKNSFTIAKENDKRFLDSIGKIKANTKNLAETIVLNIRENPNDWTLLKGKVNNDIILPDLAFQVDTMFNRKCNIKIALGFGQDRVLLPDTFDLNKHEIESIYTMFNLVVYQPMIKHREDSIANIRKQKEQLIIKKMCQ